MSQVAKAKTVSSTALRSQVRTLVRDVGAVEAARQLGLSRLTTLAILAGIDVRPGSIALAEARIGRMAAGPNVAALSSLPRSRS